MKKISSTSRWANASLLINFATRGRPDKWVERMQELLIYTTEKSFIAVVIDDDQTDMYSPFINRLPAGNWKVYGGKHTTKVDAINRGVVQARVDAPRWKALMNMSDDMKIKAPFEERILSDIQQADVLHYPDGYTGDELITMSVMSRDYYDEFGYIYNPAYKSLWCDNEFTEVAQRTGAYKFINYSFYTHEHPAWTGQPMDQYYRITEGYYEQDRETYMRRKFKENFQ